MDTKMIKNLISVFEHSSIAELSVSEEEEGKKFAIEMKKTASGIQYVTEAPAVPKPVQAPAEENTEGVLDFNNLDEIRSPMVGVFYAASSPDAPPFVTKGSRVKKGDTLCIIEAMKLMNEVVAERDGEIVEVCTTSGSLVEFGQVLFKIF